MHDLCNILKDSWMLCPFRLSHTQVINTKYKGLFCVCSVLYSSALRTDLFQSKPADSYCYLLGHSDLCNLRLECVDVTDRMNSQCFTKQHVQCVFCEVWTEFLFFIFFFHINFVYLVVMAQKARRRPLITETWIRFHFSPCEYVVHRMVLVLVFLRVLPPIPIIITPQCSILI